jgi:hypothetical protein
LLVPLAAVDYCGSYLQRNFVRGHPYGKRAKKSGNPIPPIEPSNQDADILTDIAIMGGFVTWYEAMKDPLSRLPMTVIQVVSDEAKALLKYTRDILQAHHSPDVFHVQQDIIKATTPTLRAGVKSAREALQQANTRLQTLVDIENGHRSNGASLSPEQRLQHDQALDKAADEQATAIEHLVDASTRREAVLEANRGIGQDYHPIDLVTGKKRTSEQLAEQLNAHFATVNDHAEAASVSGNSIKRLQKAQRVVDAMVLTLKFFWCWIGSHIDALNLPDDQVPIFENQLLPMAYIDVHLPKARNAEQRQQRRDLHRQLEIELNDTGAWQSMTDERKEELQAEARKCALVFQRSSSCVEGRNGQLSLKHHASRKMSARKLAASTVIHN